MFQKIFVAFYVMFEGFEKGKKARLSQEKLKEPCERLSKLDND